MNQEDYTAFVLSRFKTAEATALDITQVHPDKVAMLHATMGMVGEVIEYMHSPTEKNAREELADLVFFVEAAMQVQGLPAYPFEVPEERPGVYVHAEAVQGLLSATNAIMDFSKKEVIYAKTLKPEQEIERMMAFAAVLGSLTVVLAYHGYTIEQLRTENEAKLMKRYANGYSNEAAAERADKKEGEA